MTAVERLITTARAEIGYIEKETNAQLDNKTANAGDGNWNKYARDLDSLGVVYNGKKNGYAWCDIFVDWCFIQTFGLELGMKLLCQAKKGLGAGCTYSANYYKQKGQFHTSAPQPGDQIFFTKDGGKTSYHTGLVVDVKGGKVYTIEGNTSSTPGVVENGGMVRDKSYSLSYAKIAGYGRPDYTLVREDDEEMTQEKFNEMMAAYEKSKANPVPDSTPADWEKEGVEWATSNGLMAGGGNGDLMLHSPLTRGQFCVMLKRYHDELGG